MKNKNAYKDAVREISEIIEKNPHLTRKDQYNILENFFGIPKEEAEVVNRYMRAIREVIPKDEVGEKLESEWHMKKEMRDEVLQWDQCFRRTA